MNIDKFLQAQSVEYDVIPHRATYDAQRLAQELHVTGHEVAKTVLVRCNHGYQYVVAVLPADRRIDMEKMSEALGGSELQLATEVEIAEHCPDCEFGALPPFGTQYGMQTIVDESLTHDETIVFEGNAHDEAIRMKFADFQRLEEPLVAPFTVERRAHAV